MGMKRNLTEGWFFGILPDMNTENPVVEQYLLQNSIWWAEISGLDGYRVDTFPYVERRFWANWHAGLRRLYPYLTTIGEVFHPRSECDFVFCGRSATLPTASIAGYPRVFDFPMFFTLRDVLLPGRTRGPNRRRAAGRCLVCASRGGSFRFFANRRRATFRERRSSSPAKLKLAFGLTLTLRGIPEIYYGDENPGCREVAIRTTDRDFPGGWIGDANDAFTESGRTRGQQEIFSCAQSLLRLRREHAALRTGRLWHLASDESSYVFARESEEERVVVAFNQRRSATRSSVFR